MKMTAPYPNKNNNYITIPFGPWVPPYFRPPPAISPWRNGRSAARGEGPRHAAGHAAVGIQGDTIQGTTTLKGEGQDLNRRRRTSPEADPPRRNSPKWDGRPWGWHVVRIVTIKPATKWIVTLPSTTGLISHNLSSFLVDSFKRGPSTMWFKVAFLYRLYLLIGGRSTLEKVTAWITRYSFEKTCPPKFTRSPLKSYLIGKDPLPTISFQLC